MTYFATDRKLVSMIGYTNRHMVDISKRQHCQPTSEYITHKHAKIDRRKKDRLLRVEVNCQLLKVSEQRCSLSTPSLPLTTLSFNVSKLNCSNI